MKIVTLFRELSLIAPILNVSTQIDIVYILTEVLKTTKLVEIGNWVQYRRHNWKLKYESKKAFRLPRII